MKRLQYIACRIGKIRGRVLWRLYRDRVSNRALTFGCPVGDYTGHPGKSGLRKIREQIGCSGRTFKVSRIVRDQVVFTEVA